MEPESEMGPARFRLYNLFGLVLGIALLVAGVLALFLGGGPVLGWVMIGGGLAATVAALMQLRRS
jgi:hypothetical protein